MKKYVAVVGTIAAGKTTTADILKDMGYQYYKLSSALIVEAEKRGLPKLDRTILQDIGDELREERGNGVLAELAFEKIKNEPEKNWVIDSIRNHHEVMTLQKLFGNDLIVISVDTPMEVRYQRSIDRGEKYNENKLTFEEFIKIDKRDRGEGNDENEQNVIKCMELADFHVSNDSTIQDLHSKVLELVKDD